MGRNLFGLLVKMKKIVLISVIVFSIISLSFTNTQQIDAQEEIQAKQILQEVSRAVSLIRNYRCQLSTICRLGDIEEKRIYNYVFQSPKFIRMEIIEGKDRGTILVYRNGFVRARRGGFLSFLTLTFKPSDKAVTTIRGGQVDQTDFGFIVSLFKNYANIVLWKKRDKFEGQECDVLELLIHDEVASAQPRKGYFWISRGTKLVLKYELYDSNELLVFQQIHRQIELNVDLPPNCFNL